MTEAGRRIRGVYLPVSKVTAVRPRQLAHWVSKRLGANAVILDVKDDRGRVTFSRQLPTAQGRPHGAVRQMRKYVEELKKSGIYVIGRLVCFKDNFLPRQYPKTAIRDRKTGKIWRDRSVVSWLDPFSPLVHEHIASVAQQAQQLGFDEIQLDYVRFPVESGARYAIFPCRTTNQKRYMAIAALLSRVDQELSIPLSIDVFGLTAFQKGDPEGLGQSLEHLAPYLDAISPMLYVANWPRPVWEDPKPSRNYSLVHDAVRRVRQRLGDQIAVRPLLQGFRFRAANFGRSFIHNQIDAAQTAGSSGHLFWNQFGNYYMVSVVWQRLDRLQPKDKPDEPPPDLGATEVAKRDE